MENQMAASPAGAMTKKKENGKLSWKSVIGYGFGEAGSQFSWTLISSYLTVYYTDVVGLTPIVISVIMLVARICDAINDPMFGSIAENYTHTKWGRFRPYILFGAPFLALFNCLTFLNLNIPNSAKSIWCAVTYICCGMAYTAVSISVGSLANCMTASNTERVRLNASRNIIGNLAGLVVSAITMPLILAFGGGSSSSARGYFIAALILSVISIPCFVICFSTTKEVISGGNQNATKKEKGSLYKSIIETLKDHDSRVLIIAMVLVLTAVMGRVGIMAYYFIYILNNAAAIAACASALTFGMVIPGFYAPFLLNRFNKKYVGAGACVCMGLSCVALYFAGEAHAALPVLVILHFIYGASNAAGITCYSLTGEIIDDAWIRTGRRNDGAVYSMISFGTKLGNAIGGSVGILALGAVGFVANTKMSAKTLTNMDRVINFGPMVIFILAAIAFLTIRMTNKKGKENEEAVKQMLQKTSVAQEEKA